MRHCLMKHSRVPDGQHFTACPHPVLPAQASLRQNCRFQKYSSGCRDCQSGPPRSAPVSGSAAVIEPENQDDPGPWNQRTKTIQDLGTKSLSCSSCPGLSGEGRHQVHGRWPGHGRWRCLLPQSQANSCAICKVVATPASTRLVVGSLGCDRAMLFASQEQCRSAQDQEC